MSQPHLQADDPLLVGEMTLIPVAEVFSFSMVRGERASFAASKRPKAVVALGPWGVVALDVEGEEVSLEELADEVPGLRELVARNVGSESGQKENKG